jgi:hypothetical protein
MLLCLIVRNEIVRVGVDIGQSVSVGIETGYEIGGTVSIPGNARFFSSLQRPDGLWGPPSLLSNGYRGLLPRE